MNEIKKINEKKPISFLGFLPIKKWYMYITIPIAFFSMMIVIPLLDNLFIIIVFGLDKFEEGLRFESSKLGILNNGEKLLPNQEFSRFLLIFITMLIIIGITLSIIKFFDKLLNKNK